MKCPSCGKEANSVYYQTEREGMYHVDNEIPGAGFCIPCNQLFTYHITSQSSRRETQ